MYCEGEMFIFVSSRRRHTRSLCDWSSDVCSSDLIRHAPAHTIHVPKGKLRHGVALIRGLAISPRGLGIVLWHGPGEFVHEADVVPGTGLGLLCCLAVPLHRFVTVLLHSPTKLLQV